MQSIIDLVGVRGDAAAPLRARLTEAGFAPMEQVPPLAERFVIVDVRDVTEGAYFGYEWRLRAALVVATSANGPWRLNPGTTGDIIRDGHEGVVEIASVTMPAVDFSRLREQVPELADRIRSYHEQATVPAKWRAWNQVARAEWHLCQAEGARQGVWDRLYRDGLLDELDRADRGALVEWALRFGTEPMALRSEERAHDHAVWPINSSMELGT